MVKRSILQFLAAFAVAGFTSSAWADDRQVLALELSFIQYCTLTHGDKSIVDTLASREKLQKVSDPKAWSIFVGNQGGDAWIFPYAGGKRGVLSLHQNGDCMIFASGIDPVQAAARYETLVTSLSNGRLRVTKLLDRQKDTNWGEELDKVWLVEPMNSAAMQMVFGMTTYSATSAPFQVNWRLTISKRPN